MTSSNYIARIDRGTSLYWHTLARARGLRLYRLGDELEWVASDPPGGVTRVFRIDLPADTIETRIREIISRIEAGAVPSDWLITGSARPAGLIDVLAVNGFDIDADTGSGMALDLPAWRAMGKSSTGIRIVELSDKSRLAEWIPIINEALFECELFSYEQIGDMLALPHTHFYLGLLYDAPAAVAMSAYAGDVAELCWLATLPPYRGKGLGTALIARVLGDMRESGAATAVLRAEKDAIPLYRRIGFTEYYTRMSAHYRGK